MNVREGVGPKGLSLYEGKEHIYKLNSLVGLNIEYHQSLTHLEAV